MRRLPRVVALGAVAAVAVTVTALPLGAATPPVNDTRATAQILELPASVTGSTVGATAEASDPQCQPRARETVWYRFSRATPGAILVGLQTSAPLDAVAAVYELRGGQLKLLRCEATGAARRTLFSFQATPAPRAQTTYFIVVGQQLNSDPGDFTLTVSAPDRPANDERPGAILIARLPADVQGTTIGATTDRGDPDCGDGGPTVWYRLDRQQTSRVTVRLHAGGNLDVTMCAVLRVRSELRVGAWDSTDDRGNAALAFDAAPRSIYYLVVVQKPRSEPGSFRFLVTSPPRPGNDERQTAARIGAVPTTTQGTTVGSTQDGRDPECVDDGPTVWYRLDWPTTARVVVRLRAGGDLDARVCVVAVTREKARKPAEQLTAVISERTDKRGDAAFDFPGNAGQTYYVIVSQLGQVAPGRFVLTILKPDDPPAPPGAPLSAGGARGRLDPLLNPEDAWAVSLRKGASYRFTVVTKPDECVSLAIYSPLARSFEDDQPALDVGCADTAFFTPGPDGGGTHPVLVSAESYTVAYRLFVARLQPDDIGPGVPVASGQRVSGSVSPGDPLDLYRFDVERPSNVQIEVASPRDIDIQLKNAEGKTVKRGAPGQKLVRTLRTGTYYVALRADDERLARYALRVLVRYVTLTAITVNGSRSVTIEPGDAVSLQTTTTPDPGPGTTRVQADFFDVATGTWVFREIWDVVPGSRVTFSPNAVGRWRVRATFNGNRLASPSRSSYASIVVSTA